MAPFRFRENRDDGDADQEENFYSTIDDLESAIMDGRFPSPPARALYFVTKGKPGNPVVADFLNWVLNEGQQFIKGSGYVQLTDSTISAEKKKLE